MAGSEILFELGLIIGIAAVLAIIGRLIKQPSIIAYLITGILAGPLFFDILRSHDLIEIFSHLGVAFLLFLVGLSLDFRILKEVGKVSFIIGITQVIITSVLGFGIALWLGFGSTAALFLAAALAFSSTVFVIKLLHDKKEIETLHGKIIFGILIIQDFIAAVVLLLIPIVGAGGGIPIILQKVLMAGFLAFAVFLFARIVMPGIISLTARNQEVLLLFSIGWALLISMMFQFAGFSVEIGALIAGLSLASSRFSLEIESKIKSLREFFVIIHLVFFGTLLVGPVTWPVVSDAIIFSLLILIGNPLIVMTCMKFLGYKKNTNFLTGISIAQISEFSLILVFLGMVSGAVSQQVMSLTVMIALITIGISTYEIHYSRFMYKVFSPFIEIFNGKGRRDRKLYNFEKYDVILFGYNRIGFNLLKAFKESKKKYLIVDYNPKIIEALSKKGINCVYGDASDEELLKSLNLDETKVVISTIPVLETNLSILGKINENNVIFIPTSHLIEDTKKLYDEGADYVIMPHFLGGEFVSRLLVKDDFNKKLLDKEGKKHRKELDERLEEGHEHPTKERHGG